MSGFPDPDDLASVATWNRAAARLLRQTLERIMASSASTTTPAKHVTQTFADRVANVKVPKSDIHALILDYLTMEGYSQTAAHFSKEANLMPYPSQGSIKLRQHIRNYIHKGNVMPAIEALNDFDHEILDRDAALHFALLRLQLVELIRKCTATPEGDIIPALEFATTYLAPRAPTNPQFLRDLEDTMGLLIFPHNDDLDPSHVALLHPHLRRDVAEMVNAAILSRQSQRKEAAIRQLSRMRVWAEASAREAKKPIPERIEIRPDGSQPSVDPMLLS
ncbi:ran binding protein in the microtubule-organising centre [Sodiomyces alkalinus F11]|uniref:Ran binding protein in the microtubule-organising centre n=1 Tax=Sodiomyces alkalinus (strain CBS 110278 / VKM F-3762 / F11) TaxID=1314773 RepID=A0A3N2Q515_SODAK|nr:ran binding protein in the microtubule-organising centre [Sodiomyces alkalinus F11]ROT41863.1 ran binding protein in the microtubule-organising centre [Sodiomyces alkalinus F11]